MLCDVINTVLLRGIPCLPCNAS